MILIREHERELPQFVGKTLKIEHEGKLLTVLARREDSSCIYLGAAGCTIHPDRPQTCRTFDCRQVYVAMPKAAQKTHIRSNPSVAPVYEAGRTRLNLLRKGLPK